MTRSYAYLALVALVLALGVVLKVGRYGRDGSAGQAVAVAHVHDVMGRHGWQAASTSQPAGGLISELEFRSPACQTPVVVAFLAGNAEGAEFFRRQHGGDVMFVQSGRIVAQPSGMRRQAEILLRQLQATLGIAAPTVLPMLAIAPAADATAATCRGPAMADWQPLVKEQSSWKMIR